MREDGTIFENYLPQYDSQKIVVYLTATRREGDVAAFVWDGSKLVPTDARTLAKRSEFVAILTCFGSTSWPILALG